MGVIASSWLARSEAKRHDATGYVSVLRDRARGLLRQRSGWKLPVGMDSHINAPRNFAEALGRAQHA